MRGDSYERLAASFGHDLYAAFEHNGGQPITLDDVESIAAEWTDGADEPNFAWLLKLKNRKWACATGGHDYTGWDCHSSLSVTVHKTRKEAIRFGLTLNDRENLGLLLPDDGPELLALKKERNSP